MKKCNRVLWIDFTVSFFRGETMVKYQQNSHCNSPGTNGGISIMEGYAVHKTLLTSSDMQAILTGLRSLDSVSGTGRYAQLMEKLSVKNLRNGRYPCRICIRRQYISRITQQECFCSGM